MPVLKIKKNNMWVEVWGASIDSSSDVVIPKTTSVTLYANSWTGNDQLYYQSISITSATMNSKIDLQPTAQQIVKLQDSETALTIQNNGDGTFTAFAIGNKPVDDYIMQALITEVLVL